MKKRKQKIVVKIGIGEDHQYAQEYLYATIERLTPVKYGHEVETLWRTKAELSLSGIAKFLERVRAAARQYHAHDTARKK